MARADGLAEDLNDEEDDAESLSAGVPADGDAEEGEEEEVSASSSAAGGAFHVSMARSVFKRAVLSIIFHSKCWSMLVHNVRTVT